MSRPQKDLDKKSTMGQDWPLLTAHQQSLWETMGEVGETQPDERKMALISKALMLCPLPFRKTMERQIVSETRVPGGSITTIITALDDKILLPHGKDSFVLDALSSEARRHKTPIITTENLADLMRLLKMDDVGGENYKRFLARIARIGAFAMRIKRKGVLAINARIVDIDGSEFWSKNDVRREKRGERKVIPGVVKLSDEYYADLMNQYAAVPIAILDALSANPTAYSLGKWLWYRSEVSETETVVPWDDLMRERGSKDSNVQRFKAKVRSTLTLMGPSRPEVKCLFKADTKGLRITPIDALPKG
jgi:hypothetical protein